MKTFISVVIRFKQNGKERDEDQYNSHQNGSHLEPQGKWKRKGIKKKAWRRSNQLRSWIKIYYLAQDQDKRKNVNAACSWASKGLTATCADF